ncbi:unnamed protein product [Nezara viridula]|uniref:Uncharacterized protein n=1 Tax=Nezara viridula TaxID=85310 RepID=A0A9P0H324_NEZVI|nr:unnamed protein product [Nezara viridula]
MLSNSRSTDITTHIKIILQQKRCYFLYLFLKRDRALGGSNYSDEVKPFLSQVGEGIKINVTFHAFEFKEYRYYYPY